jgi:hypothetical protein
MAWLLETAESVISAETTKILRFLVLVLAFMERIAFL